MKKAQALSDQNIIKTNILNKYIKLVERKGFSPTRADVTELGFSRDKIRNHFGSYEKLNLVARQHSPEVFQNIVDEGLFTKKNFDKLVTETGKYSRYIITTAIEGCQVHEGFLNAIDNYLLRRKAMLLVLPSRDPAAQVPFHLDKKLADRSIIFDDISLNNNFFVSTIRLSAKHTDPTTGLARIGQRNGSFVYASPKQRLKMTPTSNIKLPHALMTTGALTKPDYHTSRYLSERTAYIADNDHVMGAVIVEIVDDEIFHFRQIQADRLGNFVDLGVLYCADGSTKVVQPDALVLGDWHSGETDPGARSGFVDGQKSLAWALKPKRLIIHDGFNGRSISHHEIHNKTLKAQRALANQLNLEQELLQYRQDLDFFTSLPFITEIVISKSNHDEFLDRYISEGRYLEDPQNYLLGTILAQAMVLGTDPVQAFMQQRPLKNQKKIRWLNRDEDYKIARIELGAHGDKGANGSKGNLGAMEGAYGNSVSGHSHTPEILRGAWQVGTCSLLKLTYVQGPSSWLHTSCLVYPNGSRQLINAINGKWCLKD